MKPPEPNDVVKGCWYKGIPIHQGNSPQSLNKTSLNSNLLHLKPNQKRLYKSHQNLYKTLLNIPCDVQILDFPEELNQPNNLYHDAVFVRDSGMLYKDVWIKANFSVKERQKESDYYAKMFKDVYKKEIKYISEDAYIEFGEIHYINAINGNFYFGGLSRSNIKGHNEVVNILKPDKKVIIESKWYHLDTVLTPVINSKNELTAIITSFEMLTQESIKKLKKLNMEIIEVDAKDTVGLDGLGSYAINAFTLPGYIISGVRFSDSLVEKKLSRLEIKYLIVPVPDFELAGGSIHCLTNEVNN